MSQSEDQQRVQLGKKLQQWATDIDVPPNLHTQVMEAARQCPIPQLLSEEVEMTRTTVPDFNRPVLVPENPKQRNWWKLIVLAQAAVILLVVGIQVLTHSAIGKYVLSVIIVSYGLGSTGREGLSEQEVARIVPKLMEQASQDAAKGNNTGALFLYQQVVHHLALPLNNLAWVYFQQGKAAQGLPWARMVVKLEPENPAYLDTLAEILCALKESKEAIQIMEKVVKAEPQEFQEKLTRFREGSCW